MQDGKSGQAIRGLGRQQVDSRLMAKLKGFPVLTRQVLQ